MPGSRKRSPEMELAVRSLESDQELDDGVLASSIERDGDVRIVRVRDAAGGVRQTMSRFPAAAEPSRVAPDWLPFIPLVGCMLTESPGQRMLIFHISSRPAEWLGALSSKLGEALAGVDLMDPASLKRPDGTLDHEAVGDFIRRNEAQIPADLLTELKALRTSAASDTAGLDRAWEQFAEWHRERGWSVDERDGLIPGGIGRAREFRRGAERRIASATSMAGIEQIMVFFRESGESGGALS